MHAQYYTGFVQAQSTHTHTYKNETLRMQVYFVVYVQTGEKFEGKIPRTGAKNQKDDTGKHITTIKKI